MKSRCLKEKQKIYYDQRHQTCSKYTIGGWYKRMGIKRWGQDTRHCHSTRLHTEIIFSANPCRSVEKEQISPHRNPFTRGAGEASTEDQPSEPDEDHLSEPDETEPLPQAPPRSPIMTRTRTGTAIRPPLRF